MLSWLCSIAWAVGCSKGEEAGTANQESDQKLASASQALSGTVAVTINAPNPLSVLSPVLVGSNSVALAANANVVSGTTVAMGTAGLSAEPGALLNDAWSRGKATLKDRVQVRGVLHAATATLGNGVVITGGQDTAPVFDPPATVTWNVTYPSGTGPSYTLNSGQSKTLSPGLYGSIILNSGATLTLSAGTYYLVGLDMESASTVKLDQTNGPVIIYMSDKLILRGTFVSLSGGDPDLLLGYLGQSAIYVETLFNGAIIAPFASLTLRQVTGTHTGYFYAKDVANLDGAKVQYRAPLAVATAGVTDLTQCSQLISAPANLSGRQQTAAFQAALARYCTMPGSSQCTTTLVGRANADYAAAAQQMVAKVLSPAQYIALSRDRTRKFQAAQSNPAQATDLCTKNDADGDWVIDSKDKCPGTPDLTATDDNGCPLTTLPQAPNGTDVLNVLGTMGIMYNPRCTDAPPPAETAGAAIYQAAAPANGTFIVAERVQNQPTGCPVWYMFEIREMPWQGTPALPYVVAFKDTEEVNPVGGLAGLPNVPTPVIQFNAKPSDPGTRGQLGSIPLEPSGVNFRVQAINGNGQRGPWSQWKLPTQADCRALGITCGVRQHAP
jgi:hypothetical protein